MGKKKFNPPPNWPKQPAGFTPREGWSPPSSWEDPPPGWKIWIDEKTPQPKVASGESSVVENESSRVEGKKTLESLELEIVGLKKIILEMESKDYSLNSLSDEEILISVGVYNYHHPLENSIEYKDRLKEIQKKLSNLAREGKAIQKSISFTLENSVSKGEKMSKDLSALMLNAYNSTAENCIRTMRAGNVETPKKRLGVARNKIARLGRMMEMQICDEFHSFRIEEIELTADYLMKKKQEREIAREERARLREENRVKEELRIEREKLDKEKEHLMNAIAALKARGELDVSLEEQLQRVESSIATNDFRAANIRAGYVYVISNHGAFGKNVVKIGLTRRLEPNDRIKELSGAAVPFKFEIHCLCYSDDAVTLETELHQHFSLKKVNLVNPRKEFFFASPSEVKEVLLLKSASIIDFNENADSLEYLQSVGSWPDSRQI
jgi:hypothetical protein